MTITDDNEVKGKINKRTYKIASTFFQDLLLLLRLTTLQKTQIVFHIFFNHDGVWCGGRITMTMNAKREKTEAT